LYPLDVWEDNGRADRPGELLRYNNALPDKLCDRLVSAFSDEGQLVADPFVGSGSVMLSCLRLGRRFAGSDLNPNAIRFAAARLLSERPELLAEHEPALAAA
jgi:site-specific DNA-methyltransferase (adenine-specific)